MDILEHPLEAVAFRLYSLPDASVATGGAAWTCLAAVLAAAAAAAGLWRLRFSTPPAAGWKPPLETEPSKEKEVPPAPASSSPTTAPCPSPKERYYTAFYYRVGCCGVDDEEGEDEEEEPEEERDEDYKGAHQTPVAATDPFGWEVVRSLPLTPKGSLPLSPTGRYRSPTAHGSSSVVRLWDEAGASPRRRSRVASGVLISQRPGKER
jgi:hypothetical protein